MHRVAIVLLILGMLVACGGGTGDSPDITGEWEFAGGTADGAALPQPAGASATLELDGGELNGVAFCNRYFGSYRLTGSSLSLEGIGSSRMACEPDVMAAEDAYLAAFGAVDTAAIEDADLLLTGEGVELSFTR